MAPEKYVTPKKPVMSPEVAQEELAHATPAAGVAATPSVPGAGNAEPAEPLGAVLTGEDQPVADRVRTLEGDVADLKDRLLRAMAEMENLRKRTTRDVADARAYGIAGFARDILEADDNLARALAAVPKEETSPEFRALVEGLDITRRTIQNSLARNDVTIIEAKGGRFNPHRHEAMYEIADPQQPPGTIVEVIQVGYMIGERVLRPAKVGIAGGGAQPPEGPPEETGPAPIAPHGEGTTGDTTEDTPFGTAAPPAK